MNNLIKLDHIVKTVRHNFQGAPPNGWLLGWDESRCFALISGVAAPHRTTNCTSFDYGWCNWYEVRIDNRESDRFSTLSIRMSHIVTVYSLHWTQYISPTTGTVMPVAPKGYELFESKVRAALENAGFCELPDEWLEQVIEGVALELSGQANVTLGKCLFNDYEG